MTTETTPHRAGSRKVVLATGNAGKLREITALLDDADLSILPLSRFTGERAQETGLSYVENAILKARQAAAVSGLPAIADDSGLEVEALGGAPGIHSARYAGSGASDSDNVAQLLHELRGCPEEVRRARFVCVMVFLRHAADATPLIADGTWEGRLLSAPRGRNGFGYDPIFHVPGHAGSAAELTPAIKNLLSHRAQASRRLCRLLTGRETHP
ncbi:MAG: RdgB/HAM1 family non-canonical purine NTP pyrophosphatase [Gammaproteobacteria bacterium]